MGMRMAYLRTERPSPLDPCRRARHITGAFCGQRGIIEGSSRKPNPCGKRRNHSNKDKLAKAKYQALAGFMDCTLAHMDERMQP